MKKVIRKLPEVKMNRTVTHTGSTLPKYRVVIDVVYLSYFTLTTHRYLIIMVDHFSNCTVCKNNKE